MHDNFGDINPFICPWLRPCLTGVKPALHICRTVVT